MTPDPDLRIRPASLDDSRSIRELIAESSRSLGAGFYGRELIEAALETVLGLDTRLVEDGTYFVAWWGNVLAGCGGWSRRFTLFGSDNVPGRDDRLLDPAEEAARIRAFFVHPHYARRGIGSRLLERCEREARQAGFSRLELGATLSGLDFYLSRGYLAGTPCDHECAPGIHMKIVPMSKFLRIAG